MWWLNIFTCPVPYRSGEARPPCLQHRDCCGGYSCRAGSCAQEWGPSCSACRPPCRTPPAFGPRTGRAHAAPSLAPPAPAGDCADCAVTRDRATILTSDVTTRHLAVAAVESHLLDVFPGVEHDDLLVVGAGGHALLVDVCAEDGHTQIDWFATLLQRRTGQLPELGRPPVTLEHGNGGRR